MAKIPLEVAETALSRLLLKHLNRVGQGKVRDTYRLSGDKLLPVVSDRLSSHDYIMTRLVPYKGVVLNLVNIFMRWYVLRGVVKHDLIAAGTEIDGFLPLALRGKPELQLRATAVMEKEMILYEIIPRNFLTGSAYRAYAKAEGPKFGAKVLGHDLPPGLHDGSRLPEPIFTATTKAQNAHDQHVSWDVVASAYPWLPELAMQINLLMCEHAEHRGYYLADQKLEFGTDRSLADEVGTPDACRYWRKPDWLSADSLGKPPRGWDKEPVRQFVADIPVKVEEGVYSMGDERLKPEIDSHVEAVHKQVSLPDAVVDQISERYIKVSTELIGCGSLADAAKMILGVDISSASHYSAGIFQ